MVKQSTEMNPSVPQDRDNEKKAQGGLERVVGSRWLYALVLVFAALLSVGIWSRPDQMLKGEDMVFQVARLQSVANAWENGQILPQVDPGALGGFGYAYNLFCGPILTYVAAGLRFVIGSWPLAMNAILVLCIVSAGLTMCYAITRISRNRILALLVSVIYMATPYFLQTIYTRMALGEATAMVAAPILLLGLYQLTAKEKHAARSLALAMALLILSHSTSALLFGLVAIIYIILNIDKVLNLRSIWRVILALGVALGLTAFFTVPMIEAKIEGDYGVFRLDYAEMYLGMDEQSLNSERVTPQQLVSLDYAGNTYGVMLGVMAMIGILGFWFTWRTFDNKSERRFVASLYIIAVITTVLTLPIVDWSWMSSVVWRLQYPWRMMMLTGTLLSVVAGYTIFALVRRSSVEKQAIVAIVAAVFAVYFVTPIVLPNGERHVEDFSEIDNSSVLPEELAKRGTKIKVVEGQAKLGQATKDGLKIEFDVRNTGDRVAIVELPVIWYPGYRAYLDGVELGVNKSEEYGLVMVVIPAGERGIVSVDYELTKPSEIGMLVSASTAGLGLTWVLLSGAYEHYKQRKQKEVDSLIDSVWEAMAETEELKSEKKNKSKRKVEKTTESILPEPPEPKIPSLPPTVKTPKRTTRTRATNATKKSTSAKKIASGDMEKEVALAKKASAKKTTTRVKTTKAKAEAEVRNDEIDEKPRVTKVKAGSKKEA